MSVTTQITPLTGLQRTDVVDEQGKMDWHWMQWLINLLRLLNYLKVGTGTPEATVAAPVGTLFLRLDGGANTVLYVKETGGSTSTGWAAK